MNTSGFSVKIEACFDDALLKLGESLRNECFEIISEDNMPDKADVKPKNQNVRLLCECNSKTTEELLENAKAFYIPRVNFLVHELDHNNTDVTGIDPQISMTPNQLERMGVVAPELSKMLKNVIRNL